MRGERGALVNSLPVPRSGASDPRVVLSEGASGGRVEGHLPNILSTARLQKPSTSEFLSRVRFRVMGRSFCPIP